MNQNQNQLLPQPTIDHQQRQQNQQQQQPVIAASFVVLNSSFNSNTLPASSMIALDGLDYGSKNEGNDFGGGENNLRQLSIKHRQQQQQHTLDSRKVVSLRKARSQVSPSSLASTPKLVQWAREAVQYYEGSTLVLSCSLAMSNAQGNPLKFTWFKQGKQLSSSNNNLFSNNISSNNNNNRLSIETLADYSFLRLADLRSSDSGAYTCVASNSFGQEDRTTAQVIVNGR